MGGDARPPEIEISDAEELDSLRTGTRTPRPYHRDAEEIEQHGYERYYGGQATPAGSESGTEADDERPDFVKALPAPHLRPRKGLKTGEQNQDALLTPSQLDDDGRRLQEEYFGEKVQEKEEFEGGDGEELEKLFRRRLAEFARRSSEVALMCVIAVCVLCGAGVLQRANECRRELLAQVVIIIALILGYPFKLSIVDTHSQATKFWQRFRVPASFDPATVLYPPLLPVLVALSVSPSNASTVLPNIILGLSSLPQRLFPRSSRLGGINALHWFIAIIPLIAAANTASPSWLSKLWPTKSSSDAGALPPETLVSLYPLHHALLQPLHYLTTTSLLISELHLLSTALINVLLLADSPQTNILKACLWIGGVGLFACSTDILHWNVTLMRVPKWKFRRPGYTAEERKSLVDAVSGLVNLQRATSAFKSNAHEDSDADEDEPRGSIKRRSNGRPKLSISNVTISAFDDTLPKSADEARQSVNGSLPELIKKLSRPRRNTVPERETPANPERQPSERKKEKTSSLLWCLHLTPRQAQSRKWLYAAYVYVVIAAIILIPVRYYVLERALNGQEPIGWAVGYLLGQLDPLRDAFDSLGLNTWISLPAESGSWKGIAPSFPLDIPTMRSTLGAANVRLLLIAYWALVLLAGLLAVFSLTAFVEVDTRRKVFHGVMVAMMLPATFVDPCACALALALILGVFLLLEVIRAGQLLPLGNAIGRFVAPYVDGRDLRGPVVVSHLFLLIGCAVPLWFSLASIERTGRTPWAGWELRGERREVAMLAGVICVGMGDAAASLIGRRYGRRKWVWVGGKSIEGSAAFAAAVTLGLVMAKAWLVVGGWSDNTASSLTAAHLGRSGGVQWVVAWSVTLLKAAFCACGSSFMEAVLTGANDNVVVPVALWLLVKGVRV